jgi:hypothetical protein
MPNRIPHGLGINHRDLDPAPDAHLKDPARVQCADGLTNNRARDAELLSELALGRERVAWLQVVLDDRPHDVVGDTVGEPGLGWESPERGRASRVV